MSTLALVGASGLAREVLAVEERRGRYDEIVAVDDDPALWGKDAGGVKVCGPIELVKECGSDLVICAGSGAARRHIAARLDELGVPASRFAGVLDPSVHVPSSCSVGTGSILLAGTVLTADVRIGAHVVVMPNVVLTHDDEIADFVTLCASVTLGGGVRVEEAAYLGMSSSVRQHTTVGAASTLGMGSVLLTDLPPGQTWAGVPAHPIRQLDRSSV